MSSHTCLCWVKAGVCRSIPNQSTQDPIIADSHSLSVNNSHSDVDEISAKYGLQTYDVDNSMDFSLYKIDDVSDNIDVLSDEADDVDAIRIDTSDSVLITGCVNGDYPEIVVYVYNPEKDYFYVHHDLPFLSAVPVAIDILESDSQANYIVVAGYDGSLQLWDLDEVNSLQPTKSFKKYNTPLTSVIANGLTCTTANISGNVLIWDIEQQQPTYNVQLHKSEVSTLDYLHDSNLLLSCSSDRTSIVSDSRSLDNAIAVSFDCEVTCARWNVWNPYIFLASCNNNLSWIDIRNKSIFHSINITNEDDGLEIKVSNQVKDMTVAAGSRGYIYVFDNMNMITKRDTKMGSIIDLSINPDHPFVCAITGDAKRNVKVKDLRTIKSIRRNYNII